jgi:TM2 domain-containing membrane protein YozV
LSPLQPKYNASGDRIVVGVIAIFLGTWGLHKFLLGYKKEGVIMLGVSLILLNLGNQTGFVGIIGIVEGVIYMTKSTQDFARIYISGKRGWF